MDIEIKKNKELTNIRQNFEPLKIIRQELT